MTIEAENEDHVPDEPAPDSLEDETPAEIEAQEPEKQTAVSQAELPQVIEALLFVSHGPLSMAYLKELTRMSADAISEALVVLADRYHPDRSGVVLSEVANGWLMRTGERQKAFVHKVLGVKPQRLTRAALETLALVAYRQPITRPEMEDVRGVDCGAVLKALLDRRLVKILGKKEEPGRPLLYGTSKEFLEFFGLKTLTSMPTLREFRELTEENRSIVEQETGETGAGIDGLAALADNSLTAKLAETEGEAADAMADLEAAMAEVEARSKLAEAGLVPTAEEGEPKEAKDPNEQTESAPAEELRN